MWVTNIQLDEIHEILCRDILKKLRQHVISIMVHTMPLLTNHTSIEVAGSDDSTIDYKS